MRVEVNCPVRPSPIDFSGTDPTPPGRISLWLGSGSYEVIVAIARAEGLAIGEMVVELKCGVVDIARRRTGEEESPGETIAIRDRRTRVQREYLLHGRVQRQAKRVVTLGVGGE